MSFHGASKLNCVLIQYWGQFYTVYHDKDKKGYKKSKNHNGKIVNKKKKKLDVKLFNNILAYNTKTTKLEVETF